MNPQNHQIDVTAECIPDPWFNPEYAEWNPGCTLLIDGEHRQTFRWALGFPEKRFTIPYSRELARQTLTKAYLAMSREGFRVRTIPLE